MTAPESVEPQPEPIVEPEPTAVDTPPQSEPEPEPSPEDELPEWARKKLDKANREAKNLRDRLKAQEPKVQAAEAAEREKMSELERERADKAALAQQLAARNVEFLQTKYGITDDYLEFLGDGTFEEMESRAAKIGQMVQSAKHEDPTKPPTQRPVESLRPGASPTPPPVADTSYPASWGFQPPTQ
ncbi:hypothetical protein [Gordonia amicalis]|uniref:hypothetical protein n=1 Tax=Gordonia amicalis TaxID=89053 RepID=UPI0024BB86B6|nr:hypothetical protein [Gordonia amicalis]MDJ0454408.1 hypothetical protein [Gordonia amicalis]MDV7077703.1 hypothetical protein [Gordonia amicalis]